MSPLALQNRWNFLRNLDGDDDEVEKFQFASSSSKQEVKKKSKKEQGKILVNRFQSWNISFLDLFNEMPDEVKSLVRRRRRIELINEIPVKSLIRKRWGSEMRGRNDFINTMPDDVKSLIFSKVGAIEILLRLQYVCSSWWKLSKDPYLFRVIDARDVGSFSASKCMHCYKTGWHYCRHYFHWKQHWVRRAVDRSCGQLTELYIGACANDELLHYVLDKSNALKCLVLKPCSRVTSDGLIEAARKVPLLEALELTYIRGLSKEDISAIVQSCLNLHKFALYYDFDFYKRRNTGWFRDQLSYGAYDVNALAIAENLPKLRDLTLTGNLTNKGLQAILDGCPFLEYLDIRGCELELQEQCSQRLKHLTLPDYDLYDCDKDPEWSHPSFTDQIDNLHDYIDKSEWSSSEEDDDDEDILKYLPPKADTFYV